MGSFGPPETIGSRSGGDLGTVLAGGATAGLDDAALLRRMIWGSPAIAASALVSLMERYGSLVARVCGGVLGDHHAAEDATQAVFLILHQRGGSLRNPDQLAAWLHGVALRTARHARRRTRRAIPATFSDRAIPDDASSMSDPTEALMISERAETLHAAIQGLPRRYRTPLILCDLQGWTHAEAAAHLGCPLATLSSRVLRAKAQLRDRLIRRDLDLTQLTPLPSPVPVALLGSLTRLARTGTAEPAARALARQIPWTTAGAQLKAVAAAALLAGLASFGFPTEEPAARRAPASPVTQDPQPATVPIPPDPTTTAVVAPSTDPMAPALAVPPPAEPIRVGRPTQRAMPGCAQFDGWVAASRMVELRPATSGIVRPSRDLAEGDPVAANEPLFTIEERPDSPQKQEYEREVAKIQASTTTELETLDDQIEVIDRRLQPLLAQAKGQPIRDASLNNEWERLQALRQLRQSTSDRSRERLAVLKDRYGQDLVRRTMVSAPFAGIIADCFVDRGATVEANTTPLATIAAVDPIQVDFTVEEGSYNEIRRWLRAHPDQTHVVVRVGLTGEEGFPHVGRARFQAARFERGGPVAQTKLHAEIPNPDRVLVPGLTARVVVEFGDPHPATLVPIGALSAQVSMIGNQTGIWPVDATGKLIGVRVVTAYLPTSDGLVEIRETDGAVGSAPIEPTTRIVVAGADRIRPDTVLPEATKAEGDPPR